MHLFNILASLTSGVGSAGLIKAALTLINSQPGGIGGLIKRFHEHGAGDIVSSWVASGPNMKIDPEILGQVLGSEPVAALAQKAGISTAQVSGLLALALPKLVDRSTPGGQLPVDGKLHAPMLLSTLGSLAGLFGKKSA